MQRESGRLIEVLVVEDNPGDRVLLELGLQESRASYRLHVAEDGEQAIRMLVKGDLFGMAKRPDLILLDLNLPKRSGHEVLEMIRADEKLQLIPVVVLTSSNAPSDIRAAYERGANSYLRKPSNLEDTLDLMQTVQHYWLDLAMLPDGNF